MLFFSKILLSVSPVCSLHRRTVPLSHLQIDIDHAVNNLVGSLSTVNTADDININNKFNILLIHIHTYMYLQVSLYNFIFYLQLFSKSYPV